MVKDKADEKYLLFSIPSAYLPECNGSGKYLGNLEEFAPNRVPFSAKTFRGFHYVTIAITYDRLELRIYTADGKLIDMLEIQKK